MALVCGAIAVSYGPFIRPFVRYMLGHVGQAAILLATLLLCWGLIGVGLGIPNLIWDEHPPARMASAMGATLLLALLGVNAYYLGVNREQVQQNAMLDRMHKFLDLHAISWPFGSWLEPDPDPDRPDEVNRWHLSVFLRLSRLPFLFLISLPALFPQPFTYVPWNVPEVHWGRLDIEGNVRSEFWCYLFGLLVWGLGVLAGIVVVKLLLRVSATLSNVRVWLAESSMFGESRKEVGTTSREDRGREVLASALALVQKTPLGGFRQYLLVVIVIYVYLGLCSSELLWVRGLAILLLLTLSVPQMVVTHMLWNRGRASREDYRAAWVVCVLLLICGVPAAAIRHVSPAFAIFALLGLLATAHVVYERRDVRPVYYVFGAVLLTLVWLWIWRAMAGESFTPHDAMALVALAPIFFFGLARGLMRGSENDPEALPLSPFALSMLLFFLFLALAYLRIGTLEWPAVALAAIVCLLGCCAVGPIMARDESTDAGRREQCLAQNQCQVDERRRAYERRLVYDRRRWILLTSALVFWILLVNYDPFKDHFEAIDYDGAAERLRTKIKKTYPYNILELAADPSRRAAADGGPAPAEQEKPVELLENYAVLESWKERVQKRWGPAHERCSKPKLVIVCVSGGAIRSAYWAATVLEKLGGEFGLPDIHDHVRLITGASGGMVGMGYYVATLAGQWNAKPAEDDRPRVFEVASAEIPSKSLNPVAGFIALQAPWRMLLPRLPGSSASDRGQVLERDWETLRQVTFAHLRHAEQDGAIPSLVFSPMIVDDGRRLLISNLDLTTHKRPDREEAKDDRDGKKLKARLLKEWPIPVVRQDDLDNDNDGAFRNTFAISALELFKLVPNSQNLSLATAARMSATFPFVSPAVNLPTNPPLRVVDAGYYDNYGVHLANAWILQNREWLRENTSGILVVQTRDSVSKQERMGVPSEAVGFLDQLLRGAQLFGSVSEALLRARFSTNAFRNDEESIAVNEVFRRMGAGDGFVATVVFENTAYLSASSNGRNSPGQRTGDPWPGLDDDGINAVGGDVPMSWYLTNSEKRAIGRAIPTHPEDEDYTRMLRIFQKDWNFFYDNGNYKLLRRALSFASLFAESRRFQNPDEFDVAKAKQAYDRFLLLGKALWYLDPRATGATLSSRKRISTEEVAQMKDLLDRTLAKADEKRRGTLDSLLKKFFVDPDSAPKSPPTKAEGKELGCLIRLAIDIDDNEAKNLDESNVLLYAHSEWLNDKAGFESSSADVELKRAYFTREFERTMNYYRLQAVKSWWPKDHSTRASDDDPGLVGDDKGAKGIADGNRSDSPDPGRHGDDPGGPGRKPVPLPGVSQRRAGA